MGDGEVGRRGGEGLLTPYLIPKLLGNRERGKGGGEGRRGGKKSVCLFTPPPRPAKGLKWPGLAHGWCQEQRLSNPGLPCEWQESNHLRHHHCLPASTLVGSQSWESNPGNLMRDMEFFILTARLNAFSQNIVLGQ